MLKNIVAIFLVVAFFLSIGNYSFAQTDDNNKTINIITSGWQIKFEPTEIKVNQGDKVIWTNKDESIHTITSGIPRCCYENPDDAGKYFDSDYLAKGDSFEHVFTEPGIYNYYDRQKLDLKGLVAVSKESVSKESKPPISESNSTNLNEVSPITWKNFTNDQSLFAIEYPSQWDVKAGNRFTDDPPFTAYNNNDDPSKVKSQILVNVFDSEGLTAKKWAELKKAELVDKDKSTKLVEPISCNKYIIDNVFACSFVYAGNDEAKKRAGILNIFVVDSSNMTHIIEYTADPTKFDSEEPLVNHIINSYKLINNYPQDSVLSSSEENATDTFYNSSMESSSLPPAATLLLEEDNITASNLTEDEIIDSEDTSIDNSENFSVVPPS